MWPRFTLNDLRVVAHYLGVLISFATLGLLVPFVTAIFCREWTPASHYLLTIGLSLIIGTAFRFANVNPGRLTRTQAIVVTGLAWIVLAFLGTIPLYLSGHYTTYMDALFDGVSGITTTGASIIEDLDHLSYADNMWRFVLHLVGGMGLIVVAQSFGLFGKSSGATMYMSEGRSEHVVPNIMHTSQFIAKLSLGVILLSTALLTVLCLFLGMNGLRAFLHGLWLSISGFLTGGFAPTSQSVMYYHSFPMELILMVLMVAGAINFILYSDVWKGRVSTFFKDLEIRTMVLWLVVMTCVFTAALIGSTEFSGLPVLLRRGLFTIIASFTTTGFQNITVNQMNTVFTSGAFLIVALLMAVGGSSGSTAGGIKFSRLGLVGKSLVANIKETVAPDSARIVVSYYHAGRRVVSPELVKEATTVLVLYIITYLVGALVGIAHGYEATQAIFESVAMASNGGLSCGIATPGMPVTLELFYIFEMWAGRLEFVTLIALIVEMVISLNPLRWGGRR